MPTSMIFFLAVLLSPPARADGPPIGNFSAVTPAIYRGKNFVSDNQAEAALTFLQNLRVAVDMNLQGGDWDLVGEYAEPGENPENIAFEKALAEEAGMRFVNLPLSSVWAVSADEEARIDEALEILRTAMPASAVYIHCEQGVDRTGLVVALYRVREQGWAPSAAYDEWVRLGHGALHQFVNGALDDYFFRKTARP